MNTSESAHHQPKLIFPDAHLVRKSTLVFRALNHPLRQKILSLLLEKNKMTVTELYELLFLEQSVVSQHLAILRRTGFVKTKKQGKFVWYMLQEDRLSQIHQVLNILMS
ncbi:MAG: ArsR/SmtB family transcription factor [Bacteroidota bacterium]